MVLDGKNTYADQMRIEQPNFRLRSAGAAYQYGKQLIADNAYYHAARRKPAGRILVQGVREPSNLDTRESLSLNGEVVLITPRDYPQWLKPDQCFLKSGVDFEQLTGGDTFKQLSSTAAVDRRFAQPEPGTTGPTCA